MSEYRLGDYNRGGYIAFMFSMAFTVVFFIYLAFIHPGVDLKEIQIPQTQTQDQQKEVPVDQPQTDTATETAPAAN